MPYAVQTPVFEGPLDILLHLITKQQVELYEVSISTIVDGFLSHLDRMQREAEANKQPLDLETVTEFLLIAATLVQLKTQRLLPGREDMDLDEELALWEERDLLLARLVECKTFKDASLALVALEDMAKRSYARRAGMEERFLGLSPDPLAGIDPERLRKAFMKAIAPKPEPPKVTLDHVTQIRITVQDAMEEIIEQMPRIKNTSFRQLTSKYSQRLEVIVHFLGLLELYKQGVIELEQARSFGELQISWLGYPDDVVDLTGNALAASGLTAGTLTDEYEG
jgi:segregation and condensation protein A